MFGTAGICPVNLTRKLVLATSFPLPLLLHLLHLLHLFLHLLVFLILLVLFFIFIWPPSPLLLPNALSCATRRRRISTRAREASRTTSCVSYHTFAMLGSDTDVAQHGADTSSATDREKPCRLDRVTWYREPHLRRLFLLSIFLLIGSATTGFDGMLQNTSQQMDSWKAFFPEHADANKLGILINMYNVGCIASFFFAPSMADLLGRKPTIMAGCVIMIAGACITGSSTCYASESPARPVVHGRADASAVYIGGRFVLGFGNSLSQVCSPMLLTEICHPQHRGRLTTVYNCLWNLGSLRTAPIPLSRPFATV